MAIYLSDEQYRAALQHFRQRIADGVEFKAVDDTTPGAKSTEATWGLCDNSHAAWPDPETHLFQRPSPKYRDMGQKCPMDTRAERPHGESGCFYACRIFTYRSVTAADRERALALYDELISS